jgi:predicted esterase
LSPKQKENIKSAREMLKSRIAELIKKENPSMALDPKISKKLEEALNNCTDYDDISRTKNNISSIPNVTTPFHEAIWSTGAKEDKLDAGERAAVEQNLRDLQDIDPPEWASAINTDEADKVYDHDHKLILGLEQLASEYVYHSPQAGKKIMLPTKDGLKEYEIEEIPFHWGMSAFGFKPVGHEGPTLLVFRGTSFYTAGRAAASTWLTDVDPTGIGHTAYKRGDAAIKEWLNKQPKDSKIIASGHSLGAGLATEALAANQKKISNIYTFGSVMVNTETAKIVNQDGIKKRALRFYGSDDPFAAVGFAGCGREFALSMGEGAPLPDNEEGNKWRLKSESHRRAYLQRKDVKMEEKLRPELNIAKKAAWKTLFTASYPVLYGTVGLKRTFFGSRNNEPWFSSYLKKKFKPEGEKE